MTTTAASGSQHREQSRSRIAFYFVVFISAILCFVRLGAGDVKDWDEARNGMNAWEMLRTGDPINLYYDGELDTWNAKPPMMIWFIAASYKLFGYNEWALRLPSAVSGVLFFAVFFALARRLAGWRAAAWACVMLWGCKAVIDHHVFRTGDFDGLLVFLLTTSVYCFVRYLDGARPKWALACAAATGLAFFTKGTAAFVLLPGMALYLAVSGQLLRTVRRPHIWLAGGVLAAFVGLWCALILAFGKMPETPFYESRNALETMLVHDTFRRLTDESFTDAEPRSAAYFFVSLDARFNLWNYVLYLATLLAAVGYFRKRAAAPARKKLPTSIVLPLCLVVPLAVMLTLAVHTHDWYLAPAMPFVALLTAQGVMWLSERWRYAQPLLAAFAFFTIGRHVYSLVTPAHEMRDFFAMENDGERGETLIFLSPPKQHAVLYCAWRQQPYKVLQRGEAGLRVGQNVLARAEGNETPLRQNAEKIWTGGEYTLLKIVVD